MTYWRASSLSCSLQHDQKNSVKTQGPSRDSPTYTRSQNITRCPKFTGFSPLVQLPSPTSPTSAAFLLLSSRWSPTETQSTVLIAPSEQSPLSQTFRELTFSSPLGLYNIFSMILSQIIEFQSHDLVPCISSLLCSSLLCHQLTYAFTSFWNYLCLQFGCVRLGRVGCWFEAGCWLDAGCQWVHDGSSRLYLLRNVWNALQGPLRPCVSPPRWIPYAIDHMLQVTPYMCSPRSCFLIPFPTPKMYIFPVP